MKKEKKVSENEVTIENIQNRINEYLQQDYPKEVLLKIEPQILELQNAKLSSFFAENVPNAQIAAHQEVVMQYGSFDELKYFATAVAGADKEIIGKCILTKYKDTNPLYIYDFLNWMKIDPMAAIDYMVEIWDVLDGEKRTILFQKYIDKENSEIFYHRIALKVKNAALEKVDEISALIRTYQNESNKA